MIKIRQWLPGDRLILSSKKPPDAPQRAEDEFYLISADTGQVEYYQLKLFGDFVHYSGRPFIGGLLTLLYSPDLSRAVYAWEDRSVNEEGYLMWDIENEKVLWMQEIRGWFSDRRRADWQQDGSQVVIPAPTNYESSPDLFKVSSEGIATRVTYLSEAMNSSYDISQTLWSPNGRYIAFIRCWSD